MSEGSQVSKVTLCVKIQKWQSVTHKGRYRAARAAKKTREVNANLQLFLGVFFTRCTCKDVLV